LLVAIPAGYATAVWPPRDRPRLVLLLAAASGRDLAGRSLVNSPSVFARGRDAHRRGNTLEALAGAALVRAFIACRSVRRGEDVVKFVAIAAASATIAATVAAAPLALRALSEFARFVMELWTWWLGGPVGIIVVAPLILA